MKNCLYRYIIVAVGSLVVALTSTASAQSYSMKINGNDVPVLSYNDFHYAAVSLTSTEFSVELTSENDIQSFRVSPKRLNINTSVNGKTATFTLPSKGYYVVFMNDKKLFIFIDEYEEVPQNSVNILSYGVDNTGGRNVTTEVQTIINTNAGTGQTLVFPAGIYMVDILKIPSYAKIHLTEGAVLKVPDNKNVRVGSLSPCLMLIKDAQNVEITGRGILDGNGTVHMTNMGRPAGNSRVLLIVNSQNVTVNGITMRDAGGWNTHIVSSQHVNIENVKVLSNVNFETTDGINPDCSQYITIKNCFAYNGDDNVAVKTSSIVKEYPIQDTENITVQGNVFLTKKSSFKLGTETLSSNINNIIFKDNDIVEADRAMSLYSHDGAVFDNIRYVNNHIETYFPDLRQCWIDFEIRQREVGVSKLGNMKNILIKDCVFYDHWAKGSRIRGYDATHRIQVTFDNNTMNGTLLNSLQDMNITSTNGFEDIIFKNTTLTSTIDMEKIVVFPSLTNGMLTITGHTENVGDKYIGLNILDIQGKILYRESCLVEHIPKTIDISGYNSGIYFVKIFSANEIFTTKIIKH